MNENTIEISRNDDFSYGRINQENAISNNNEQNVGIDRRLKSSCLRCCSFSYKNSSQLTVAICFALIFLFGILKAIFGGVSISSGFTAIILAKQDSLHWSGIFLLINGFSSMICGIAAFRSITYKRWSKLTAKQLYVAIFGMFNILLFDIIAVVMVAKYNEESFPSNIQLNLRSSLLDKYGVSSSDFKESWDHLQRNSLCCGATSFTEWFQSAWADKINATSPSRVYALPLSCHYENIPHGICLAVAGVPVQTPTTYLLMDQYTFTTHCDLGALSEGTLDYIYPQPCSQLYIFQLSEEMRATMAIAITYTAADFAIIITLAAVALRLPFQQRVNIYNA